MLRPGEAIWRAEHAGAWLAALPVSARGVAGLEPEVPEPAQVVPHLHQMPLSLVHQAIILPLPA